MMLTTVAGDFAASALARNLVEQRLAGCVQRIPISSIYRWEEKVEETGETLLLIKTTVERASAVQKHILQASSYEVAEVIVVPIIGGSPAYLEWLEAACGPERSV
jgi:periplasmic divalent cation tolerance protein